MITPELLSAHAPILVGKLWVGLPEYPDYLISDRGDVLSFVKRRPRVLRPIRAGAYRGVQLRRVGGLVKKYVHRLVAEAFHGPAGAGQQCRHLDGNRDNNDALNLAWGTVAENHADKARHGTTPRGERNPMARLTYEQVAEMRRIRRETGASHRAIGDMFGVSTMTAYRAVEGQSWKA